MYLVELEAGREQLYDSVNALAAAIRRGDVGPRSRIFHRASSSWISITLHPEFKKASAAPQAELPPLARTQWTFFGLEPRGREVDEAPSADAGAAIAANAPNERGGLRALLSRAFRGLSPAQSTSEPSSS